MLAVCRAQASRRTRRRAFRAIAARRECVRTRVRVQHARCSRARALQVAQPRDEHAADRSQTVSVVEGRPMNDEDDIKWLDLSLLVPCDPKQNPNRMSDEDFLLLVDSIRAGDFNQPLLVSKRADGKFDVVDGNHRLRALQELEFTSAPCVVREYTADQIKAHRIGMNKLRGSVDYALVKNTVTELIDAGWAGHEMIVAGLGIDEVKSLMRLDDSVPDLSEENTARVSEPKPQVVSAKPHVLDIEFKTREKMVLVRKKLKKASGKTGDLALGLLNVLGLGGSEDEDSDG